MRQFFLAAVVASCATAGHADDALDPQIIEKIEAFLASIECQMDPDDIEVETDGYDLDDVICKGGGQFDIMLDKDLNEVSRRAE